MILEIRIAYNPATGELSISGALDNGVIAMGMLEMAKYNIQKAIEANQKKVQLASGLPGGLQ